MPLLLQEAAYKNELQFAHNYVQDYKSTTGMYEIAGCSTRGSMTSNGTWHGEHMLCGITEAPPLGPGLAINYISVAYTGLVHDVIFLTAWLK